MKTIHHFSLDLEPEQKITVPFNSELLGMGTSAGRPVLHVLIDDSGKTMERVFWIFAEGKEIPQRFNQTHHVGCFEHKAEVGSHTLHVFEER